jgi:hypothetical protein
LHQPSFGAETGGRAQQKQHPFTTLLGDDLEATRPRPPPSGSGTRERDFQLQPSNLITKDYPFSPRSRWRRHLHGCGFFQVGFPRTITPLIKILHISSKTSQKLQHSLPRQSLVFAFVRRCINCILGMDLLNVCVVGGNAVSAFLSWRLQATNACDVTLVWKSGFDAVFQYGISFK